MAYSSWQCSTSSSCGALQRLVSINPALWILGAYLLDRGCLRLSVVRPRKACC